MAHPVVHFEIGGHDVDALQTFYAKAFGWTISDGGDDYRMVEPADGGLGGGLMRIPGETPSYVTVYVQVEDLQVALEKIGDLGGVVLVPPTTINETMSFALFRDPEGNVVGLLRASGPVRD